MADLKETPRQKMIGILYLVLLGLAATTITQKVLDAFRNLTVGLENSTNYVSTSIGAIYSNFEANKLQKEPERSKPYWDRAQKVKKAVNELNAYIMSIKTQMASECGGFDSSENDFHNREDIDITPRIMILHKRADTLRDMINNTRKIILENIDPKDRNNLKISLNADDPAKKEGIKTTWQELFFGDGIPLTAAFTALTKIQADLRNTESDVVKSILGDVDKAVINLDRFEAIAVAPTSYILVGQTYESDVYLTASSSTVPDVFVGGQRLPIEEGKGKYKVSATHEGDFKWVGTVKVIGTDGTTKEYQTKEQSYRVVKPSVVVSPDSMNVFYMGVDNPVSISAPGVAAKSLRPVFNGAGTITGADGKYIVRVTKSGKATISVNGELEKGKNTVLGTTEFRCKSLPTPHAKFGGKSGGNMPTVALRQQNRLTANIDAFDFAAAFTINHFTLYVQKPRVEPQIFETSSNVLTSQMQAAINSITPGTKLSFENIFATGPDGIRRSLDPILFTAN